MVKPKKLFTGRSLNQQKISIPDETRLFEKFYLKTNLSEGGVGDMLISIEKNPM